MYPYQQGYSYANTFAAELANVLPTNINNALYEKRHLSASINPRDYEQYLGTSNISKKIDLTEKEKQVNIANNQLTQTPRVTNNPTLTKLPSSIKPSSLTKAAYPSLINTEVQPASRTQNSLIFRSTTTRKDSKASVFLPGLPYNPYVHFAPEDHDPGLRKEK
jgi:hypothetical protein